MLPILLWILVFVSFFASVQLVSIYLKKAELQETNDLNPIEEKEDPSSR
jgi:hypothetical protein